MLLLQRVRLPALPLDALGDPLAEERSKKAEAFLLVPGVLCEVSALCHFEESIDCGVLLEKLLRILLIAYHCEESIREQISFIDGLQVLLEGEAQRVGSLQVGVGFPEKGDVLPQLLVSFDELILLPLDSLLVHLQLLLILLAAETFFLTSYFSILQHCSCSLNLKL